MTQPRHAKRPTWAAGEDTHRRGSNCAPDRRCEAQRVVRCKLQGNIGETSGKPAEPALAGPQGGRRSDGKCPVHPPVRRRDGRRQPCRHRADDDGCALPILLRPARCSPVRTALNPLSIAAATFDYMFFSGIAPAAPKRFRVADATARQRVRYRLVLRKAYRRLGARAHHPALTNSHILQALFANWGYTQAHATRARNRACAPQNRKSDALRSTFAPSLRFWTALGMPEPIHASGSWRLFVRGGRDTFCPAATTPCAPCTLCARCVTGAGAAPDPASAIGRRRTVA